MYRKKLKITALFIALAVIVSACGDSGTNSSEGSPPALPNFEYSQPDVSYFESTNPKAKSASPNYLAARNIVLGYSSITNFGQLYGSFIQSAQASEARFNDGVWEWTYGYSFQGVSSEFRMTAQEAGGAINWSIYWSADDGQGMSFEDYNLMNGTTRNDGLTGDWTFNSLDPSTNTSTPLYTSTWMTDGESESNIEIEIFDANDSSDNLTIIFEQIGSEFILNGNYVDTAQDDIEIFWNPDVEHGYLQEGSDERLCWDSSLATVEDATCSEVGL